jgi:hypothetical protein
MVHYVEVKINEVDIHTSVGINLENMLLNEKSELQNNNYMLYDTFNIKLKFQPKETCENIKDV